MSDMTKQSTIPSHPEALQPDWEGFGKAIMSVWPEGDLDRDALQDLAIKHHVVFETVYDPALDNAEGANEWGAEKGDPWFIRNYSGTVSEAEKLREENRKLRALLLQLRASLGSYVSARMALMTLERTKVETL